MRAYFSILPLLYFFQLSSCSDEKTTEKKDIEKKCNELLGFVSDEFNIDSTIIATKRDLEIFTNTNSEARFMKGWRYEIFGKLVQ